MLTQVGLLSEQMLLLKVTSYSLSYTFYFTTKRVVLIQSKMGGASRHPFLRRAWRGKNKQKHFWGNV